MAYSPILVFGAFLFFAFLFTLGIVLVVFGRSALQRIDRLEQELRELRRRPLEPEPPRAEPVVPTIVTPPAPRPVAPAPAPSTPSRVQPPAPSALAPTPAPRPRIEWERWLGVRGAAVLGGIFLAVAGILFFQYSIERGWITKEMRIVLGGLAGIGCLVGGEVVRKRGYALTGNAIAGAGVVILYAASWSAYHLQVLAFLVSFAAMAIVTAWCGFLSFRNRSQVIAWLGLSGGIATPILLSTGRDNPIGLFAYLLLVDVAFLFVASKRRWPMVATLGMIGTGLVQTLWIASRMDPSTFPIALVVLGVFGVLFAFLAPKVAESSPAARYLTQATSLLFPFCFAIYFAGRVDVGYHLYPLLLLCTLLAVAASWLSRKQEASLTPAGAAVGGTAMTLVWVLSNSLESGRAWELVLFGLLFVGAFLVFSEWKRSEAGNAVRGHDRAVLGAAVGTMAAFVVAVLHSPEVGIEPFLVGFLALSAIVFRLDALAPRIDLPFLASLPSAIGLGAWLLVHQRLPGHPEGLVLLLICLGLPLFCLVVARLRQPAIGSRARYVAAGLACLPFFPGLALGSVDSQAISSFALFSILVLGACMAFGATGSRSSVLLGIAACATAMAQGNVSHRGFQAEEGELALAFLILAGSGALFAAWPHLRREAWAGSRGIGWIAPVVIVIGIPVATDVWRRKFEEGFPGGPPAIFGLLLAGISLAALRGRRDELRPDAARGRSGTTVAGLHGLALVAFLLAVALALQLEREAPPFAFAAAALAAALIWKRTDQLSLKYVSAASASLTTLALVLGVLDSSFETQSLPIANYHAFDVLLPGLLLLGVALCVMPAELSRVRDGESGLYSTRPVPIVASLAGLCGLFVVFLWMNVEVQNHFAEGERFRLAFGSDAARDLSLSIAWAVYALALLFLGMVRKSGLLRWVSLILLLSTIAKVFLLDLEDLRGLYRAGSFLGLALSLLAVSWVYQRFVFRKPMPSPS